MRTDTRVKCLTSSGLLQLEGNGEGKTADAVCLDRNLVGSRGQPDLETVEWHWKDGGSESPELWCPVECTVNQNRCKLILPSQDFGSGVCP